MCGVVAFLGRSDKMLASFDLVARLIEVLTYNGTRNYFQHQTIHICQPTRPYATPLSNK